MDSYFFNEGQGSIFLINSRKASDNSEKEGSWAKMWGENFQESAEVVLATLGDALNCNQNYLKKKIVI